MSAKLNDAVATLLREVADAVVMPRFQALAAHEREFKSADEPVTIADREAEARVTTALAAMLPGSTIIGEEACAANPALIKAIGDGATWVVDPIDGTANFITGRAPFAMMIALLQAGELAASWILDPLTGRLARAERGGGAWLDDERMVNQPSPTDPADWHGIVSRAFIPDGRQALIDGLCAAVGRADPTARCAGYEYPLVATGERDFALYWRTLLWDHAPGALFVTEAGGRMIHLDGAVYDPRIARSGLLLAHDPSVAETLLEIVAHFPSEGRP